LSFLAKKIVGDGQLPDLGLQVRNLFFVDFRRSPAAALKGTRRALKQGPLPLMDHRRVNPEPAAQFFAFQRVQRHLDPELRVMLLPFRHI
jgi:hypothetical protein